MGREIRRVPPNWKHPTDENGNYQPMFDESFIDASKEWVKNCIAWENGTHEDLIDDPKLKEKYPFFWQWEDDPPDEKYYLPETEEKTWYQMYENVSEGTPVTPPFATKEELIDYLVEYGTFWDQQDGKGGWERKNAEHFVASGYAPSFLVIQNSQGMTIKSARDGI